MKKVILKSYWIIVVAVFMKVALKGTASETNGIGTRVEVFSDGKHMIREIDGGNSSHMSQNSTIAHFGLGTANATITIWLFLKYKKR